MMRSSSMVMIPPGYHFAPSDEELIRCYLLEASMGRPMPFVHEMCERDLYAHHNSDPWDVLSDVYWSKGSNKRDRVTYVLSKLSKIRDNKKNAKRRTRLGTWKGQTAEKRILNKSGELIGVTKMLSFVHHQDQEDDDNRRHDRWIMHEYSLAGISLKCDLKYKEYVICRITWKEAMNSEISIVCKKRSALEMKEAEVHRAEKMMVTTRNELVVAVADDQLIVDNYTSSRPRLDNFPCTWDNDDIEYPVLLEFDSLPMPAQEFQLPAAEEDSYPALDGLPMAAQDDSYPALDSLPMPAQEFQLPAAVEDCSNPALDSIILLDDTNTNTNTGEWTSSCCSISSSTTTTTTQYPMPMPMADEDDQLLPTAGAALDSIPLDDDTNTNTPMPMPMAAQHVQLSAQELADLIQWSMTNPFNGVNIAVQIPLQG